MKNFLTIIILFLCIAFIISAQTPSVNESLVITDGAGGTQTINFGLDVTATDGIDAALGEASLPPLPPTGVFDVRFNLPGGTDASLKDYRQAGVPDTAYSGEKIHELQYQVGTGTTIKIDWELPEDSSIMGRLQDVVLGTIIDISMVGIGSYTVANPGVFNKLKMTITYIDAVPVELTSFTGSVNKNSVTLNWVTATEINNRGFEVERASSFTTPIQGWEKIGFVQGYGTTAIPRNYTFTDNKLNGANKFYYRLKQIDYNGQYEYSQIIEVEISSRKFALYQNYPNPFNPNTTIKYSVSDRQFVTIKVYNALGNEVAALVNEIKPAGTHEVNFDAAKLSSGIYFCKLQAGSFVETRKMTLLR